MKIVLTYPTETGLQEIPLEGSSLSFGRGSEADYRFADDGLSRLHSTIFREGNQVWIVDENSTNGTFVNGQQVSGSGTPLEDGDTIRIGNYTSLKVKFIEETATVPASKNQTNSVSVSSGNQSSGGLIRYIPIVVIAMAVFVISISAVVIGIRVFVKPEPIIVQRDADEFSTPDDEEPTKEKETPTPTATPKSSATPVGNKSTSNDSNKTITDTPVADVKAPEINPANGKKYLELSDAERRQYIESRAQKVAA